MKKQYKATTTWRWGILFWLWTIFYFGLMVLAFCFNHFLKEGATGINFHGLWPIVHIIDFFLLSWIWWITLGTRTIIFHFVDKNREKRGLLA